MHNCTHLRLLLTFFATVRYCQYLTDLRIEIFCTLHFLEIRPDIDALGKNIIAARRNDYIMQ